MDFHPKPAPPPSQSVSLPCTRLHETKPSELPLIPPLSLLPLWSVNGSVVLLQNRSRTCWLLIFFLPPLRLCPHLMLPSSLTAKRSSKIRSIPHLLDLLVASHHTQNEQSQSLPRLVHSPDLLLLISSLPWSPSCTGFSLFH